MLPYPYKGDKYIKGKKVLLTIKVVRTILKPKKVV